MALTTVPASLSATALTLTTAAQPNITSVGTLTGLTVGGTISIGDWTNAINIGASNDLQLYHVSGNSHIKSDTGQLIIRTDALRVLNNANSEQILHGDADGAVTLYYDNSAKLATASGGVTVTGTLTATTLAGTLSTAAQTNITSLGTLSSLTVGGNLLPSSDSAHNIGANATRFANAYFDTMYGTVGTVAQPNITSVGTLTGLTSSGSIQTTGSATKFISNSSSSGDYIRIYAGSGTGKWDIYGNGANLRFSDNDGAGGVYFDREIGVRNAPDSNYALKLLQNQSLTHGGYFQINGGSAVGLEINATSGSFSGTALYVRESSVTTGGYLARFANSAGDKMVVETGGNVGIGTNSPDQIFHIKNTGQHTTMRIENGNADFLIQAGDAGDDGLHFYDLDNSAYRMTIDNAGQVGIGTTSPGCARGCELWRG